MFDILSDIRAAEEDLFFELAQQQQARPIVNWQTAQDQASDNATDR